MDYGVFLPVSGAAGGELFESRGAQRRAGLYGDAWFPYFVRVMMPVLLS
jgi:hypothetical protein